MMFKSEEFFSIQKFFHIYLPIAILVFAIFYIGALQMEDFHLMLHDPIYMFFGLIFALAVFILYWQPKSNKMKYVYYTPIGILLVSILYVGGMEENGGLINNPIVMMLGLAIGLAIIILYWQPKKRK